MTEVKSLAVKGLMNLLNVLLGGGSVKRVVVSEWDWKSALLSGIQNDSIRQVQQIHCWQPSSRSCSRGWNNHGRIVMQAKGCTDITVMGFGSYAQLQCLGYLVVSCCALCSSRTLNRSWITQVQYKSCRVHNVHINTYSTVLVQSPCFNCHVHA